MRYVQPAKATFDLEHLAGLGDAPSLVLLVSETTLYMLENLSAADIRNMHRYAREYHRQQYVPVTEADEDFGLYVEVRDRAQLEILEVGKMSDFYGIVDTKREFASYQFPSAGSYDLVVATVPTGEKWQLEAMMMRDLNSVATAFQFRVDKLGPFCELQRIDTPALNQWYTWTGRTTLVEGDRIIARFGGCQANDNVDGVVWVAVLT